MNKKFIILCVIVTAITVFLLFPVLPPTGDGERGEDAQDENSVKNTTLAEKNAEDMPPLYIDEWDEDEFAEDKESELLGTFASKIDNRTIFIYFDREGLLLYEIHEGDDETEKEICGYNLLDSKLNIGGTWYEFERDGDDIYIDGEKWEYLEGVILSFV